jgi:hypothetical protein
MRQIEAQFLESLRALPARSCAGPRLGDVDPFPRFLSSQLAPLRFNFLRVATRGCRKKDGVLRVALTPILSIIRRLVRDSVK